jgi:AcrR family transcriptional regulator
MLSAHFLEGIEELLQDSSYADLSVEQIIRAGKISRTTFYAYFTDKADLLRAMTEHVTSDLTAVAFWRLPDDANEADLRAALAALVAVYREHRTLLRAVVENTAHDAALRAVYQSVVDKGIAEVTTHIEQGQQAATIASELAPAGTARLLVHMLERSLYEVIGLENAGSDEEFLDPVTVIFWRTLYEGCR